MTHNAIFHSPRKHIKTKYHDLVLENKVQFTYVPTRQRKENIFTKSNGQFVKFDQMQALLNLIEIKHVD
jgi:hypothetical protein